IMISATITNTMVSKSSLPESPMRGFLLPGSASIMLSGFSVEFNFASREDYHSTDDATRPNAGQTRAQIINRRVFSNLRERRIGQNKISYLAKIETSSNRENPHRDQLAPLGADNRDTHYFPFCRSDGFYMPARSAFCLRAVIVVIRPTRYPNLDALLAATRVVKPDLRKLWIGKSDPSDAIIVNAHCQSE